MYSDITFAYFIYNIRNSADKPELLLVMIFSERRNTGGLQIIAYWSKKDQLGKFQASVKIVRCHSVSISTYETGGSARSLGSV